MTIDVNELKGAGIEKAVYYKGVSLVVVSAVVFSSAGIFTKAVSAGSWEVIFWRGVFAVFFTTIWVISKKGFHREFVKMGKSGLAAAVVSACGTAAFITSFKITSVANVALIYAASPLIAALIAWVWIKEPLTRRVAIGCLGAIGGVAIVVNGSIGSVNLTGDFLALWMTFAMAFMMVIYRRYPDTPAAGPAALASILLVPFCMLFGDPFAISLYDLVVLAAFGLIFAVASVTLAEGARRIPASETALLSILETPIAPILAWIILSEVTPFATVVGGGLILVSVVWTQVAKKNS